MVEVEAADKELELHFAKKRKMHGALSLSCHYYYY
jgi:hypothetical protein